MNENQPAILEETIDENEEIDFDNFELDLENKLQVKLEELELLETEKAKIGNPESLCETIKDVVWEQFVNQIGVTAGEDFIKKNKGMNLDLSDDAHIQTTENFKEGKIATHNTKINYQERYDSWQANFQKDENGNILTHTTRANREEATLVSGARKPFDEGRPIGSKEKHTDMDHTISAAEIIRDPGANAHMTKQEQVDFANSKENLYEMDSSLNRSKGDKSITEWLDNPNSNGQKPKEIFDITDKEEANMRQKDKEARSAYEQKKKIAEENSVKAGKQSQQDEAMRITGTALKAVAMQLLASMLKEIISELIKWFKLAKRSLKTLIGTIKKAVGNFVANLKNHIINAGDAFLTSIATAIWGPIVSVFKKIWMALKQGWKSLKRAYNYITAPENKKKPLSILMPEVGKIIIAGLSAVGAIVLGEVISKALLTFPFMAIQIPLLGSLASLIGIFLGAVVSGIIGALAINLIDKLLARRRRNQMTRDEIDKQIEIIAIQTQLNENEQEKFAQTKNNARADIDHRHQDAYGAIENTISEILEDEKTEKMAEDVHNKTEASLKITKDLLEDW